MTIDLDVALAFAWSRQRGVLVTVKRDGRPQLSNILYVPRADGRSCAISVTDTRAKTANLRRDPRASLHVTRDDFFAYVVLEGEAVLSPVSADPDDPVVDELVTMYRTARGEHPDWPGFRRAMVDERRLVVTVSVTGAYGMLGG